MTVLGEALAVEFAKKYSQSRKPLSRFLELVRSAEWHHMNDVKATMPATDYDPKGQAYIFDVGGNKYRLIAAIDFEEQLLVIESVMTHEHYSRR